MNRQVTAIGSASRDGAYSTSPRGRHPRDITSLAFFGQLVWLDGRNLLQTIEPYRRDIFTQALDTYDDEGAPKFNLVLAGRGKKNWKSCDLVQAALFSLLMRESEHGSDCIIIANDEDQAGDDLALAKKLVRINPELAAELVILKNEIRRKDGGGTLKILPAHDAVGAHGKTAIFVGIDEAHGYRDWDLLEGLQPDPTRRDVLTWITSYDVLVTASTGTPLADLKQLGLSGTDPRMLFSWYSGDYTTDPAFRDLPPEQRANPSMGSWPEGAAYLDQQRRRLPNFKFRRLHLNLPGAATGAFLDPAAVFAAIVKGRHKLAKEMGRRYFGFVDMSGGSSDDAALCIVHLDNKRVVVDVVMKQAGDPPFNPRNAINLFASTLREYGLRQVTGDAYAGLTFREDFRSLGIRYDVCKVHTSELYEELEPRLNAREIEVPENEKLQLQLLNLVVRGMKVGHPPGHHDDLANAVAGAVYVATNARLHSVSWGTYGPDGDIKLYPYATTRPLYEDPESKEMIARRAGWQAEAISRREEAQQLILSRRR